MIALTQRLHERDETIIGLQAPKLKLEFALFDAQHSPAPHIEL